MIAGANALRRFAKLTAGYVQVDNVFSSFSFRTLVNDKGPIILVCTGLGRVQRGFEMYITSLAEKLQEAMGQKACLEVWSGGAFKSKSFTTRQVRNWYRGHWISKNFLQPQTAFNLEQRSFALGMLPMLLSKKPAAIYLGEYQLYCFLYKIRKLLGLRFSLVLYTGGQAIPGLFNESFDYIHHVTDYYLPECAHIPGKKQFLIPHFIETDFVYEDALPAKLRQKANGKKIVLSVGIIDRAIKRMDYLVESLAPLADKVFPVILGETSEDHPFIRQLLETHFGANGYLIEKVPHTMLGNYYRAADLFVLCSPKESFGLASVEALFHGLPVISDDFKEARFVLKGMATYLPMKSTGTLTNCVEKLAAYTAVEEDIQQRQQFVQSRYVWPALNVQYTGMFETILANN